MNVDVVIFDSEPTVGKYRNIKYLFKLYSDGAQIFELGLSNEIQEETTVLLFEVNSAHWMNSFILNIQLLSQIPIVMAKKLVPVFFDTYRVLWSFILLQTKYGPATVYQKSIDAQALIEPKKSKAFGPHYIDPETFKQTRGKFDLENIRKLCISGDTSKEILLRTLFLSVFEFLDPKIQTQLLTLYQLEGADGLKSLVDRMNGAEICQLFAQLSI